MKIGDFAKACNTKISVLRHYDKEGLLKPVYIDCFTEYRYYDSSQTAVFERISQLKSVGFTLAEIRAVLYTDAPIEPLFEKKRAGLEKQLHDLEKLKQISGGFTVNNNFKPLVEDISIPFVNDPQVIGKWQVIGEEGKNSLGDKNKAVYFLPKGEKYWCFGWTKGKLIFDDGESRFVNDYRLEERSGELYMVVNFKTQGFNETGETTPIALKKLDSTHYTREQITRTDDHNRPFVNDERVIGTWRAYCFIDPARTPVEDFVPEVDPPKGSPEYSVDYFKEITFENGGHVTATLGGEVMKGDDNHTWTKGCWLRKYNQSACAYKIKEFDSRQYLIIEWKSGDYRYGGRDTDYYVMVKA